MERRDFISSVLGMGAGLTLGCSMQQSLLTAAAWSPRSDIVRGIQERKLYLNGRKGFVRVMQHNPIYRDTHGVCCWNIRWNDPPHLEWHESSETFEGTMGLVDEHLRNLGFTLIS